MMYRIRKNNLYGFIDEEGTVVINPVHDLVFDFQFGACIVIQKLKYGLISPQGEWLIEPLYQSLSILGKDKLCMKENRFTALTTFKGKPLTPFEYGGIFNFSEGMAVAYKGLKFGYLNDEGKEVIPFKFNFADSFQQGYAMAKLQDKYGLVNTNGDYEKTPLYDFYYAHEHCYVVNTGGTVCDDDITGGKFGILSKNNTELTDMEFDFIGMFNNGEAMVKKEGLYGSINEKGKLLVPIKSTDPVKAKEEFHKIERNKKYGLAWQERELIHPEYQDLVAYPVSRMCWVKQNDLYGIITFENTFVVSPSFELITIFPIHSDHVHIQLNTGKHGLLSLPSGQWLLPPEYDSIGVFKGSLVELKKEGRSFYANRKGEIVWKE